MEVDGIECAKGGSSLQTQKQHGQSLISVWKSSRYKSKYFLKTNTK